MKSTPEMVHSVALACFWPSGLNHHFKNELWKGLLSWKYITSTFNSVLWYKTLGKKNIYFNMLILSCKLFMYTVLNHYHWIFCWQFKPQFGMIFPRLLHLSEPEETLLSDWMKSPHHYHHYEFVKTENNCLFQSIYLSDVLKSVLLSFSGSVYLIVISIILSNYCSVVLSFSLCVCLSILSYASICEIVSAHQPYSSLHSWILAVCPSVHLVCPFVLQAALYWSRADCYLNLALLVVAVGACASHLNYYIFR